MTDMAENWLVGNDPDYKTKNKKGYMAQCSSCGETNKSKYIENNCDKCGCLLFENDWEELGLEYAYFSARLMRKKAEKEISVDPDKIKYLALNRYLIT